MLIEIKNISHIYSEGLPFETVALKDFSLTVQPGEFIALMGHTGSGKSTLVQHINGLLKPTSGQVLAAGQDINAKTKEAMALRHRIGMVFQYPEYQLFEETIIKDVCFGPLNMGLTEEEAVERSRTALRLVGLNADEIGEDSPFALSGGQKRRVAIAGVLAMEPEVLILDEPTAGLDPKGHNDILDMIDNIRKEREITIFLVSHNMDDVARMADRIVVMNRGQMAMCGAPGEVFAEGKALHEMGLSLPSAAELMLKLAEAGAPVNTGILTLEEAEKEILRVFGNK